MKATWEFEDAEDLEECFFPFPKGLGEPAVLQDMFGKDACRRLAKPYHVGRLAAECVREINETIDNKVCEALYPHELSLFG